MAVRLFVGNMPYGATEADLRAHFAQVGPPSQVVLPVDRETGRPRGFAFVEFLDRPMAEEAISRFNQQPFMGRPLSVSEARPREAGGGGGFRPGGAPGGGFSGGRPGGGGFGGPRPMGGWTRRLQVRSASRPRRAGTELRSAQEEEHLQRETVGQQGTRAPRVRSRNATAAGLAGSTTRRTIRRPIWSRNRQRISTTSRRARRTTRTTSRIRVLGAVGGGLKPAAYCPRRSSLPIAPRAPEPQPSVRPGAKLNVSNPGPAHRRPRQSVIRRQVRAERTHRQETRATARARTGRPTGIRPDRVPSPASSVDPPSLVTAALSIATDSFE